MEGNELCPVCHRAVVPTDYFCPNCGKELHKAPPSVTPQAQIMLYLGSVFLPPMGLFWGLKYFRQPDQKSKIIAVVAAALTIISLIVTTKLSLDFIDTVNKQVNTQMQNFQGF